MNGLRSLNKICCHDHELLVNVKYGEAKANMSTKCTVNFIDTKKNENQYLYLKKCFICFYEAFSPYACYA